MQVKIGQLLQRPFAQHVLVLSSGTALAQAISVLSAPVLTRLYGPEVFGLFAIFVAVASPIAAVACLRYEMAIMLPDEETGEAENLVVLGSLIALILGCATWVATAGWGQAFARMLGNPALGGWLQLISPVVASQGIYLVCRTWALRTKRFTLVRRALVTNTGSQSAFQTAGGILSAGSLNGLILGQVVGSVIGAATLALPVIRGEGRRFAHAVTARGMWDVARRYQDFPLFQTAGTVVNAFSQQWVVVLIGALFGVTAAGLYGVGQRVLNTPLALVGGAVADVFFERAARDKRLGTAGTSSLQVVRVLGVLALVGAIPLMILAPAGCALLFGEPWREAGVYLRILTPLFVFRFAISPLARSFSVYEKQLAGLVWQIGMIAAGIGSIFLGYVLESVYLGLVAYTVSGVVMYLIMLDLCLRYGGSSPWDLFRLSAQVAQRRG